MIARGVLSLLAVAVVTVHAPIEGRVRLAGGTFVMGSTQPEMRDAVDLCQRWEILRERCVSDDPRRTIFQIEAVAHEVAISPFAIDRTEVRVRDYRRCVEVGACAPPAFTPGDARFDRDDFPVVQVSWDDARDYCAWRSARLPTEAEWEIAARGSERRTFPWGWAYNPHLENHGAFARDDTDASDGFAGLAPVGSFPDGATPQGVLDLSGNAAEWVADFIDEDPEDGTGYARPASNTPVLDPTGIASGVFHAVRGGSYRSGAAWTRGASRGIARLGRADDVGFRCAKGVR